MFKDQHSDDLTLSRLGLLFCCSVSLIVFVLALRILPFKTAFPSELGQLGSVPVISRVHALETSAPASPSAAASAAAASVSAPLEPAPAAPSVAPIAAAPAASAAAAPVESSKPRPAAPTATPVRPSPTATAEADKTYTVQAGDTLFSIARRYGTSAESLAALNGISSTGIVKIGQQLEIAGHSR